MKRLFLLALLALSAAQGFSQNAPGNDRDGSPYQIPQTIFVGDKGRLVVPLGSLQTGGAAGANIEGSIIQGSGLPRSQDLVISRVELERRGSSARLLVDFQAYVPGLVTLPPIEIASQTFTGLEVKVSSILQVEQRGMVLSGAADPLAAPGTAALIYGTILGIILLLLALTLGSVWGKRGFRDFAERFRRRRLIRAMGRTLRRLRGAGLDGGGEILEALSREFRIFLGALTGTNCRAMVPHEFLSLPPLGDAAALSPEAVSDLFRRCDTLRFSGAGLEGGAAIRLLDEFNELTGLLDAAEKERYRRPQPGEGAGTRLAGGAE